MTDRTLFDPPRAPHARRSETSFIAARSVDHAVNRLEGVVLEAVRAAGGATCDAVEVQTGLAHQTASARVNALKNRGVLVDSGRRENTRSGRLAVVWEAAT